MQENENTAIILDLKFPEASFRRSSIQFPKRPSNYSNIPLLLLPFKFLFGHLNQISFIVEKMLQFQEEIKFLYKVKHRCVQNLTNSEKINPEIHTCFSEKNVVTTKKSTTCSNILLILLKES